ncbi:hypothetical protein DEU56DRAFT_849283 [Suillus clintonianus]|uniref:uncharacterized protein n=1 Tax=Suillus clintonianus TaxID=1904413 RepID=UPI001B87A472|nr:uncharacterized protein DEU56DRAFT_849283 [Suillus clintonianus]KAG2153277.1 hypothetical protein DEU56DRAFT_849283 [Suillus clintonianus]
MFALRAGRQTGHHAPQRRAYAAVDTVREGKHIASTTTPPWSRRFDLQDVDEEDVVGPARRTVCIRMSKTLAGGMVDAFAVVRGVERKFGRIREYRFIRDGEVDSEYQMLCWAAFQSEDSMNLIPEKGIDMSVPAATQDPTIPEGGPGLQHLRGLLDPKDVNSSGPSTYSAEGPSTQPRLIELNVQRAASDLRFKGDNTPLNITKGKKIAIGHSFYEWGGFYPLKPLYTSSPFASPSEELLPTPDHEQMRIALNKWSQILERPDPSFAQMEASANVETRADTQEDMAADSDSSSDPSIMLSQKSRRRTRHEVDSWVPLSTLQPTKLAPPSPNIIPPKKHAMSKPSTPKVSRKERLLEQARNQAREQVLQQVALRAREAESADLENLPSETLRESVEALLKDSKVGAESQGNAPDGSESEVKLKAGDESVGKDQPSSAKEKVWNLVGRWF